MVRLLCSISCHKSLRSGCWKEILTRVKPCGELGCPSLATATPVPFSKGRCLAVGGGCARSPDHNRPTRLAMNADWRSRMRITLITAFAASIAMSTAHAGSNVCQGTVQVGKEWTTVKGEFRRLRAGRLPVSNYIGAGPPHHRRLPGYV